MVAKLLLSEDSEEFIAIWHNSLQNDHGIAGAAIVSLTTQTREDSAKLSPCSSSTQATFNM